MTSPYSSSTTDEPPRRRLIVAAAIVDDLVAPTRLLVARRCRPPELCGQWEFPGGKVEPGEVPIEALERELAEELTVEVAFGVEVKNPSSDDAVRAWPLPNDCIMRLWLTQVVNGVPEPADGHDDVRWLDPEDWYSVPWLAPDVPILSELRRFFP